MSKKLKAWAVVSGLGHIMLWTVRDQRRDAINAAAGGTIHSWEYWKKNYGHKVVKVEISVVEEVKNGEK